MAEETNFNAEMAEETRSEMAEERKTGVRKWTYSLSAITMSTLFVFAYLISSSSNPPPRMTFTGPALPRPRSDDGLSNNEIESEGRTGHTVMKAELDQRISRIHTKCGDPSTFKDIVYNNKNYSRYYFSKTYNISYCKVPKAGCTFWTQLFHILKYGANSASSVFTQSRATVHTSSNKVFEIPFDSRERKESRTILVSRNPFSRLYSGYIDKEYLKNRIGLQTPLVAGDYQKTNASAKDRGGIEANFQDFLEKIVKQARSQTGESINKHFAPITAICQPCQTNPFMLVQQESFTADVEYLLTEIGVEESKRQVIEAALHSQRLESTILGIVKTIGAKSKSPSVKRFYSSVDIAQKTWKSFQIQGYIRDECDLPPDAVDGGSFPFNVNAFSDIVLRTARAQPLTAKASMLQRRRHLVGAYRTVSRRVIADIQQIYKQDFLIFGYSFEPPTINF